MSLLTILVLIPFYFIGAIPTGFLIAKVYGIDIRETGSGNPGATNVARTLGKKAGLATLAGDMCKGMISVALAIIIFRDTDIASMAGVAAVLGHCFSIPGKLKGGKGVATGLGVIMMLSPSIALAAVCIFAGVFGAFRIVSMASVIAALSAPLFAFFLNPEKLWPFSIAVVALVIVFRHHENLKRLSEGREPQFSFGSR